LSLAFMRSKARFSLSSERRSAPLRALRDDSIVTGITSRLSALIRRGSLAITSCSWASWLESTRTDRPPGGRGATESRFDDDGWSTGT
jgi:hypothetical protein